VDTCIPSIVGLTDTYYSVSKEAQEHYYILSDPSLSQYTFPLTQELHHLVDEFRAFLQSNRVTESDVIDKFPLLPIDVKTNYTSFLETILIVKPYPLFSTEEEYIRLFGLLKISINEFADGHLNSNLEKYIRSIQQLREKVPLHHVLSTQESGASSDKLPLSHTLLSTKLQKDPTCFTLADVENLRSNFFSQFSSNFSDSSSLVLHRITSGSTVISWGLLRSEAMKLNKELLTDSNREFLEKNGVDQVVLHNQTTSDLSEF